jgi:hypothetical protein
MMTFGVWRWNDAKGGMRFAFQPYGSGGSRHEDNPGGCLAAGLDGNGQGYQSDSLVFHFNLSGKKLQ